MCQYLPKGSESQHNDHMTHITRTILIFLFVEIQTRKKREAEPMPECSIYTGNILIKQKNFFKLLQ